MISGYGNKWLLSVAVIVVAAAVIVIVVAAAVIVIVVAAAVIVIVVAVVVITVIANTAAVAVVVAVAIAIAAVIYGVYWGPFIISWLFLCALSLQPQCSPEQTYQFWLGIVAKRSYFDFRKRVLNAACVVVQKCMDYGKGIWYV